MKRTGGQHGDKRSHSSVYHGYAGIIERKPMMETSAADFRHVIDVDLHAPFIVSKAVLPEMVERRSVPGIINCLLFLCIRFRMNTGFWLLWSGLGWIGLIL